MATEKKITKRENINAMLADAHIQGNADWVAYLTNELALLDKKSTAEKKPTAVQVANEGIKVAIAEGMTANTLYTVTDIQKGIPACAELSNQRVSALLRQMVEAGVIVRTEDKRKAYFSLA